MSWLFLLGAAVVIAGIAAVLRLQPKGTRPVSNTKLMGVARFVLFAFALFLAYLAIRAHGRP
jgi:hypothetical protein